MSRADLVALVAEAIGREQWRDPKPSAHDLAAAAVAAIAAAKDWHVVSSATVTRRNDPPIPDRAVEEACRYGVREPHQLTTVKVELNGEVIFANGCPSRYLIGMSPSGYQEHADAKLGHDFLQLLGHRLGVPGCADVPERLAKTGHP